jgi:hypothetical protein
MSVRLNPDSAPIAFDDPFANRQTDPASGTIRSVKSLERLKKLSLEFGRNANPVVPTGKQVMPGSVFDCQMNERCVSAAVADCIGNKVLKQLNQTSGVSR